MMIRDSCSRTRERKWVGSIGQSRRIAAGDCKGIERGGKDAFKILAFRLSEMDSLQG